ncbi:Galactose oxidase, central [Glarea lozoyensis ATCC 20868]|uniref:Galactose oxidase, central n=1 Tax=Glarea lozoyensis (strain ATCC 20868 / MF5171) TaxID=1116229 RepID=S3DEL6_GLAL2|nr:Galactose oxidase, central [Glarea lozoyensis ATCC 20868]EPE25108.1 Galactose oxidase, central [Glarea lozoyensis ATCC 20868]
MRLHVTALAWVLVPSILSVVSQSLSLPYNPTSILLPQSSSRLNDLAYAFVPISQSNSAHQLVALNISTYLWISNLSFTSITPILPFTSDASVAFIPSLAASDEINVYTGTCLTSNSSSLWRFTPSTESATGNGTWARQTTTTAGTVTSSSLPGANFLSRGFTFSTVVGANASESTIYNFGGMCPTLGATTATWQAAANYSNHMLRLEPTTSSLGSVYTLDLPASRGPPIAEAGFTITGLSPTYSNNTGIMTQQRSYVLVGGHTKSAFINMSSVALWSLPEESWTFVTVAQPNANGNSNTELAVKSLPTSVDSRSGHTAVLTEDGSQIIVYGGWVGDTSQAADPQLAILDIGTGFGGNGGWKWTIPSSQPAGTAVYGHGATMLPGNVMMIVGGQNISTSTTRKRDVPGTGVMFFNATSMQFVTNYTNPAYASALAENHGSSGDLGLALGLGLGLGLGLAAILAALAIFCCYSRRLRRKRGEDREKSFNSLNVRSAHGYSSPPMEGSERSFTYSNGRRLTRVEQDQVLYDSTSALAGYESLHPGVHNFGDGDSIPSPPRQIPRKPLQQNRARGTCQLTPNYEVSNGSNHGRTNSLGTAGPIHPIYEADEEDSVGRVSADRSGRVSLAFDNPPATSHSQNARNSDPFRDHQHPNPILITRRNTNRSVSTSEIESPAVSREREIQDWVSDWAAADALLNAQTRTHSNAGRLSPTRRAQLIAGSHSVSSVSGEEDSARTGSNLSDRSVAVSALSRSGSSSQGRSRSNSLRGFIANTFSSHAANAVSTAGASSSMSPTFEGPSVRYNPNRSAGSVATFNTARTSFPVLQAEAETLLPRPDNEAEWDYSPTESAHTEGSPSKSKPSAGRLRRGQTGWLGSIRRAIVGDEPYSPSIPSTASREGSPERMDGPSSSVPRRTVSAGATLWRRKQGKSDWEDSEHDDMYLRGGGASSRSNTFTGEYSDRGTASRADFYTDEEEEWDIERAVENRVVQVMFTVPKEKLRVVNGGADDNRSEVSSLKSKTGSTRSEKNAVSLPPVKLASVQEQSPDRSNVNLISLTPTRSRESSNERTPVASSANFKGKGRVEEIVENIERIYSPGHQ